MVVELLKLSEKSLTNRYLWRYLSLHKYIDFLRTRSLYLNRIDNATDLLEGKGFGEIVRHILAAQAPIDIRTPTDELFMNIRENLRMSVPPKENRFINCMFLDDEESMAMWQIYSSP